MARKDDRSLSRQSPPHAPTGAPASHPVGSVTVRQEQVSLHTGPLPAPEDLAHYEAVIPGLADRIVTLAEKQAEHRMFLERYAIVSEVRRANWGMAVGAVIAFTGLGGGIYLGSLGQAVVAGIVAGVPLFLLTGIFVYGKNRSVEERTQKAKIMTGQG